MPIQFDKFDQQKVDNLKTHLDSLSKKGTPKTYEIQVDGVKAVMKTDDPSEFYNYEAYMKDDTNEIKVIIYGSNASPRNDQFAFSMKAKSQKEALDMGLDGFASKAYSQNDIKDMVAKRQKQIEDTEELETLRIKVADQDKKLKESQELVETMTKIIDKAKANGNKIGGVHLGDVLSVALEGFVKRNAPAIAKATGLEGLAGAFAGNDDTAQPQENSETSFKKKETRPEQTLTEHEKEFITLFHELEKVFDQDEMLQIIAILQNLSKDKSQLTPVLELLQEQGS
jgi:hypothetical protein